MRDSAAKLPGRQKTFIFETGMCNSRKMMRPLLTPTHVDTYSFVHFLFPGTFARVCLCRERNSRDYFALKILAIHDVIRLKQVEHVKNEKNILKVDVSNIR